MTMDDKSIFISYRRSASSYIARAIFQDLRAHRYDVFMDVESIDSGPFDTVIKNQIAARAHFLVICAPGTFDRCLEPGDWLRQEIEEAFEKQRNVIPMLTGGFRFEDNTKFLTGELSNLQRLNGVLLVPDYFEEGMTRLRNRYLHLSLSGKLLPAPTRDLETVNAKIEQIAAQPLPTKQDLTAEDFYQRALSRPESDIDGKINDYSEAIRLNPEYAEAYNNRGILRAAKNDLKAAISDYTNSIKFNNIELYLPYNNRGNARTLIGDLDGAFSDYTEATRLNPLYANPYDGRGLVYIMRRDIEKAFDELDRALRIDSMLATAYSNRGWAYALTGQLQKSMKDLNKAIRLDPNLAIAYNNRGWTHTLQGKLTDAIEDFNIAISLQPNHPKFYNNRAMAYFTAQQYVRANNDFETALRYNASDKFSIAGLTITLFVLDQREEATFRWRVLVDSDSRYSDADWVGKELGWRPELVEAARKLIAELNP